MKRNAPITLNMPIILADKAFCASKGTNALAIRYNPEIIRIQAIKIRSRDSPRPLSIRDPPMSRKDR